MNRTCARVLWAPTVLLGCLGGDPSTPPGPSKSDTDTDTVVEDTDRVVVDTDLPPTAPTPYFPHLRRLSQAEYAASIRDLFPGVSLPDLSLPADASPLGYDNDGPSLAASRALVQRYQTVAEAVSLAVSRDPSSVLDCSLESDGEPCIAATIEALGERALRRPLTDEDRAIAHAVFDEEPGLSDRSLGLRLLIEQLLQSPGFLYRLEVPAGAADADGWAPIDAWALASRLSYFLWSTMPDDTLRAAARDGSLLTQVGYDAQVERLLASPKLDTGVFHFWSQWAEFGRMNQDNKPAEFNWSAAFEATLSQQASAFVADVYATNGSLESLFTGTTVEVQTSNAYLYGLTPPPPNTTESVTLDPSQRSGLLTLAPFLVGHAHGVVPSPVLRGVFVLRKLYCLPLGNPPAVGAATVTPEPQLGLSNRASIEALTSPPLCQGCHASINAAGFLFEHYDGLGRWVDTDGGAPIDSTGQVNGQAFDGAVAFFRAASTDPAVASCLVHHWLTYAWGGDAGQTSATAPAVEAAWSAKPGLVDLLRAIVSQPRFRQVPVDQGGAP